MAVMKGGHELWRRVDCNPIFFSLSYRSHEIMRDNAIINAGALISLTIILFVVASRLRATINPPVDNTAPAPLILAQQYPAYDVSVLANIEQPASCEP